MLLPSLKAKHGRTRGLSAPGPYDIRWLLFLTPPAVKTHKLSPPFVSQSRKNGTEGTDLTSGSLRPTITCEGQVWKYTGVHCKHVTSATRGQRVGGASASPEFKSKWLSCSLHIFQSAPSGGILECPGSQPSLCSLKTHFVDW